MWHPSTETPRVQRRMAPGLSDGKVCQIEKIAITGTFYQPGLRGRRYVSAPARGAIGSGMADFHRVNGATFGLTASSDSMQSQAGTFAQILLTAGADFRPRDTGNSTAMSVAKPAVVNISVKHGVPRHSDREEVETSLSARTSISLTGLPRLIETADTSR